MSRLQWLDGELIDHSEFRRYCRNKRFCPALIALLPAIITGVAAIGGGIAQGVSNKKKAEREKAATDEANKIGYDTWSQEFDLQKKEYAMSSRKEVVANLNSMLLNNTGLNDRLLKIWGGGR